MDNKAIPHGTTHVSEFYGTTLYYKKETYKRMNQVSEEWQVVSAWFSWDNRLGWTPEIDGSFSSRRLRQL